MSNRRDPRVVFQPAAGQALRRGAALVVDAVRPTLGPYPRLVAIERNRRSDAPELLDQAGVIGRRLLQIRGADEDMGAMLVRHLMWRMYDRVGDGAATAAVLFQALFNEGLRYIAAGGNPMTLRRDLEAAEAVVQQQLAGMSQPVEGQEALTHLAEAVCFDPPLARLLGEIFDIVGEYGQLDVRSSRGRDLEREYVEGMYWDGGLLSRDLATDPGKGRAELEDAAVLVSNLEINDARGLAELLGRAAGAGVQNLLIIARAISHEAMSVLLINNAAGKLRTAAVRPPATAAPGDYEDMAVLTGARPFLSEVDDTVNQVQPAGMGRVRRAWADREYFGILGAQGDPRKLRSHLVTLRDLYARAAGDERQALRRRIGRLQGGSATLWVGAPTEAEMETRKNLAERTGESLRAALLDGALPGGGAAFLACRGALRESAARSDGPDGRAAARIMAAALEAPVRAIIANAGHDVAGAMAALDSAQPGWGFDVREGRAVDMVAAGILDVAGVTRAALSTAVSAAAMALTTEVLVHRNQSKQMTSYEP